MSYEYGVVVRRQRKSEPPIWQFWIAAGCIKEGTSFLAVMDWAGAHGYEAFAAGNFDELAVPEVLLRRQVHLPPPPPLPPPTGRPGDELAGKAPSPRRPAARRTKKKPSS